MKKRYLKAGQLELVYEEGFLRYIKIGDLEVIRMINHTFRDAQWKTIIMKITDEEIIENQEGFQIKYHGKYAYGNIDYEVQCEINGNSNNEIDFSYHGKVLSQFSRNRLGFTVLHPIKECAGQPIHILHADGSQSDSFSPKEIMPHQPFKELKQLTWKIGAHHEAVLDFEGDIFETEDQRNWTDASFKTYCTPLRIPIPVQLQEGDEIKQRIKLKVNVHEGTKIQSLQSAPITLKSSIENLPLPAIGTSFNNADWGRDDLEELKKVLDKWDFVRIELPLDRNHDHELRLLETARNLGKPVTLCVFTDDENWVNKLVELGNKLITVSSLILLSDSKKTTPKILTDQIPKLRTKFPSWKIFAGTDIYFTELNRMPVDAKNLDGVSYSFNPQVHVFDDESVVETLEIQGLTVENAKRIFPNKSVQVGPVSFFMRWNPNANDPNLPYRHPIGLIDPRQYSFLGACWWLISLKYLTEAGAAGVTYFEAFGEMGWIKTNEGKIEKSLAFHLLEEIWNFGDASGRRIQSSKPQVVDAFSLENLQENRCYVVNWSDFSQTINTEEKYAVGKHITQLSGNKGNFEWEEGNDLLKSTFLLEPQSITLLVKFKS